MRKLNQRQQFSLRKPSVTKHKSFQSFADLLLCSMSMFVYDVENPTFSALNVHVRARLMSSVRAETPASFNKIPIKQCMNDLFQYQDKTNIDMASKNHKQTTPIKYSFVLCTQEHIQANFTYRDEGLFSDVGLGLI